MSDSDSEALTPIRARTKAIRKATSDYNHNDAAVLLDVLVDNDGHFPPKLSSLLAKLDLVCFTALRKLDSGQSAVWR